MYCKIKKISKVITSLLLCVVMIFSTITPAYALKSYGTKYTMKQGGTWTYTGKTDTSITKKWNTSDWRSVTVVEKVVFIAPNTVKKKLDKLVDEVGFSKSKAGVKYAVETAATYGIEKAKTKIKQKYGTKVAGYIIPYVSCFSWGYVAYDVLSEISEGNMIKRLNTAVKKNTGLIYVKQRTSAGNMSKYFYWNGSSKFGKYPTAYLGPNTWQYGKVKIYK